VGVLCSGVPSKQTVLKKGDVVSIDVTVVLNGWHADTARTFLVGEHALQVGERMVKANREALDLAIAACKPGVTTGYLASVIQEHAKVRLLLLLCVRACVCVSECVCAAFTLQRSTAMNVAVDGARAPPSHCARGVRDTHTPGVRL
jgi:methionine aminopeptidase